MRKRGFTLVEILVAAVLLGVGIAGLLGAFSALSRAELKMVNRDRAQALANTKLEELAATREYESTTSGGFEGNPDGEGFQWEAEFTATGTENLNLLRVTVTESGTDLSATAQTLLYTPPAPTEEEGLAPA